VGWDILGFLTELVLDLGSTLPDVLLPELGDLNHFEGFDNKPENPEGDEERGKWKRPVAGLLGGWSGKFKEPWDCCERLDGIVLRGGQRGRVVVRGMNGDVGRGRCTVCLGVKGQGQGRKPTTGDTDWKSNPVGANVSLQE